MWSFSLLRNRDGLNVYKDYRDFMVHAYWQNPKQYLTYTACRKSLSGDVGAIMRVHTFLETHGIINNQVVCNLVPTPLPQPGQNVLVGASPLAPFQAATIRIANHPDNALLMEGVPRHVCSSCSGPCAGIRYENLKDDVKQVWESEIVLCESCFVQNKFPIGWRAQQFVARPSGTSNDPLYAGHWTQEQTLALLSALEKYGEDWTRVAGHVGGGHTPHDCVLHFVRLPIQDEHLGKMDPPFVASAAAAGENPTLQLVSFISATLSPQVAQSAAAAAMQVLEQNNEKDPKVIASVALAAAGQRAALLAERESQRIAQLITRAVQLQLKALHARMRRLEQLENFVGTKKAELRRETLNLYSAAASAASAANPK
jgi:SWI/SNF related-matrix-associated actin-dependent regulator of chromatin subfamily C